MKFGQRWYNPTTGTWTQQDTLDAPLDLTNGNRYAYSGDDPINNMDPSGQDWYTCGADWFGTIAGFAGFTFGVLSSPLTTVGGVFLAIDGAATFVAGVVTIADGCA